MIRALAIALAAVALAASTPDAIAWQGVVLKTTGGWLPVASNDEIYLFSKGAAANPGGNPLIWLRTDWPTLQRSAPPYRSIVELAEVDCAQQVWRDRQSTEYARNNADGPGTSIDMSMTKFSPDWPPWSDPSWLPTETQYNLVRDTLMKLACANA